ncbi:transposase [Metallibacterium sp.]
MASNPVRQDQPGRGISSGFVEAMNGLIQAATARARGYRTDRNLIAICYLLCAKLKHLSTNPWIPSRVTGVQASN